MKEIRKEILVSAQLDRIWRAWTDSHIITQWFSPDAKIEATVGGPFELYFDPSDHDHESTKGCVFTLVEPKKRLGFTWRGPDQFAEFMNEETRLTLVLVTFMSEGERTRVIVEHSGWEEGENWEEARAWHKRAWDDVLGRLESMLDRGPQIGEETD